MASTRRKAKTKIIAVDTSASGKVAGVLESAGFETRTNLGNYGRGLYGTGLYGGPRDNYVGQRPRQNT